MGSTSSSVRLHICAVTCLTEKSLHVTYNTNTLTHSKIEKVQRGIQGKKSIKTRQVRENLSQQFEHKQFPKSETDPGVWKGRRSLLACHTRCKCSMATTRNSMKVKRGIKFIKLVESLIGVKVTVTGQVSECHLTFVKMETSYC